MNPELLIFDMDYVLYAACFATEDRKVEVTHIPSGRKSLFDNKTQFWGRKKTEVGGWLGDINKSRLERDLKPFEKGEFSFETVRSSQPIENVLYTVKAMINNICDDLNCHNYVGYVGGGESFRVGLSTLWKYKGTRNFEDKPLMKDEATEYIIKHHNTKKVYELEADDFVTIHGHSVKNSVVISVDKDTMGSGVKTYNPQKPDLGIVDTNCFGKLMLDDKGDVRGYGRMWKYFQCISQDLIDNYKANCFSDVKWGPKSAFDALVDCKNDKEAWESMLNTFKHLYPEPKTIVGWRGDEILIDHLYVFQEMMDMAHMYRTENDRVFVKDVLSKYKMLGE